MTTRRPEGVGVAWSGSGRRPAWRDDDAELNTGWPTPPPPDPQLAQGCTLNATPIPIPPLYRHRGSHPRCLAAGHSPSYRAYPATSTDPPACCHNGVVCPTAATRKTPAGRVPGFELAHHPKRQVGESRLRLNA